MSAKTATRVGGLMPLLVLAGCASQPQAEQSNTLVRQQAAPVQQKFMHCVFFTFKPDTPDAAIEGMVSDSYKILGQIPSVREVHAGRRDPRMTRDVNATDYTVGLVIVFDDKAGHDLYNDHPLHNQLVDKYKQHWAGVKVYDFAAR